MMVLSLGVVLAWAIAWDRVVRPGMGKSAMVLTVMTAGAQRSSSASRVRRGRGLRCEGVAELRRAGDRVFVAFPPDKMRKHGRADKRGISSCVCRRPPPHAGGAGPRRAP